MYSQYLPGNTPLHRMPAASKIITLLVFVLLTFAAQGLKYAAVCFFAAVVITVIAGVSPLTMIRKIRHVLVLLMVGFVFNLIFIGWQDALAVFVRLCAVVITTQIFAFTTPPDILMNTLEDRFHVKDEYIASVIIAMAFIPILQRTWQELRMAQEARGCSWNEGNPVERMKSMIPILIPLFRFSLEKSEKLGEALTVKGYSAKKH